MYGIPPLKDISSIIFDEEAAMNFLIDKEVFYQSRICPRCNIEMKLYRSIYAFRCTKKNCGQRISLRKNSFFDKCKLLSTQILHLIHLWLSKSSSQTAECQTGISRKTIGIYFSYFRQVIYDNPIFEENQIGGEGIIVELDESKLAKRKYNRGHYVEGCWVLGGIERTENKKTFFVPVEDRSATTLLPLIRR